MLPPSSQIAIAVFLWVLVAFLVIPAISVLVFIYGWGIQPQNWIVIISGYIVMAAFAFICEGLKKILEL